MNRLKTILLIWICTLSSCSKDLVFREKELGRLHFDDTGPHLIKLSSSDSLPEIWSQLGNVPGLHNWTDAAELRYLLIGGDTLQLFLLAFPDALAAQYFLQNSGLMRWGARWLRGDYLESCTRVGRVVLRFSHNRWRRPSEKVFRNFLAKFPGLEEESPFFALPLTNALPGESSVQMGEFLGQSWEASMLLRVYQDSMGLWTLARSVHPLASREREQWDNRCQKGNFERHNRIVLCANFEPGVALLGYAWDRFGHLVVAWGPPNSQSVLNKVNNALLVGEWAK